MMMTTCFFQASKFMGGWIFSFLSLTLRRLRLLLQRMPRDNGGRFLYRHVGFFSLPLHNNENGHYGKERSKKKHGDTRAPRTPCPG